MPDAPDFHIITGGPGSGKTTLIGALAADGFYHMPEAGRAIIRDQVAIGGTALPWADRAAFAELMLGWELRSWHEAHKLSGPVIFDRGVPDVIGYLSLCGLPVPSHAKQAAELFRYKPRVFIAPPWREIFGQDAERKQDFAEAEATCAAMIAVYSGLGYELVTLPLAPVAERVRFVRTTIMGKIRTKKAFRGFAKAAAELSGHLDTDGNALLVACVERTERLMHDESIGNAYPALKQTIEDIQGIPLFGAAREAARRFLFAYGQMLDAMEADNGLKS